VTPLGAYAEGAITAIGCLITAVAFTFASTNLVIELGVLAVVCLGRQHLLAEERRTRLLGS
jgi:hypothetical protein